MLNNMKIGHKIFLGFGLVLLVLCGVAGTGVFSNINNKAMFGEYRAAARQTTEAGRIQANMLEARLAFGKYRAEPSPELLQEAGERLKTTKASIDSLLTIATTDAEKATVSSFHGMVDTYTKGIEDVAALQVQRDEIVNGVLNALGPEMADKLGAIAQKLEDGGDLATAEIVADARYAVATMRLASNKYLLKNDKAFHEEALAAADAAEVSLDEAAKTVASAEDRAVIEELIGKFDDYDAGLNKIAEVITSRNDIINGTMNTTGGALSTVSKS